MLTEEEKKQRNRDRCKRYAAANIDKIMARRRERQAADPDFKAKKAEEDRLYRERHKEELSAKRKERRPEAIERERAYRAKNAEKIAAQTKAYREANKERRSDGFKRWHAENKDYDNVRSREYYNENRERLLATRAELRAADPLYHKKHLLKYKYGMTIEDWDALFNSQGRVCAICGTDDPKTKAGWQTDHCHETGAVRGILCKSCNTMLGHARDDEQVLQSSIEYLRQHRSKKQEAA